MEMSKGKQVTNSPSRGFDCRNIVVCSDVLGEAQTARKTNRLASRQYGGEHTVVTKKSSRSHGREDSLCRMSNPSQFDYTHHAQIYVTHRFLLVLFWWGLLLGLVSDDSAKSCPLSAQLPHIHTHAHTHYVPFLCLSLLTAQPHRHTQFSMACHSLVLCELSKLTTQSGNSVPGGEGGKENPLTGAGKKSGERERNGIRAIHTSYKTCSFHKILFFIQSSGSLHLIVLVWNSIVQRRETHT